MGDRIRMNAINNSRVNMSSLATRQSNLALSKHVSEALSILKAAEYDLIILETSGIGQSDTEITDHSDVSLYVMTPEYGAATQLEKIDMLDFADIIAVNKFDKRGALDAIRDVKKQYKRNHNLWDTPEEQLPVYGTIASQFNDAGVNALYGYLDSRGFGRLSDGTFIHLPISGRELAEGVERLRDQFLEVRSHQEHAALSGLSQAQATLSRIELAFADGPPCVAPFVPVR